MNVYKKGFAVIVTAGCALVALAGCSADASPPGDEETPAAANDTPSGGEESASVSSAYSVSCPSGYHYHYTTWGTTGLYQSGNWCGNPASRLYKAGTPVCMESSGRGYGCNGNWYVPVMVFESSSIYAPGLMRIESLNGH